MLCLFYHKISVFLVISTNIGSASSTDYVELVALSCLSPMSKRGRPSSVSAEAAGLFGVVKPKKTDVTRVAKTRSSFVGPSKALIDQGMRRRLLQARINSLEASNGGDDATAAMTGDEPHPLADYFAMNSKGPRGQGFPVVAKKVSSSGARSVGATASRLCAALPLLQVIAAETGEMPPQLSAGIGRGDDVSAFIDVKKISRDGSRGADGQLVDTGNPTRDYLAAAARSGTLPPRLLCSVCGFSASAGGSCQRCSARCCSVKCSSQHAQTRCYR